MILANAPLRSVVAAVALAVGAWLIAPAPAAAQVAIVTHHYDVSRTGWNAQETVLTPGSVGTPGAQGTFGLLNTVALDSTVEAQPLVVPGVKIAGDPNAGKHDVVYVVTDGNTIYAIDPTDGTVLLSRNLGEPAARLGVCAAGGVGIGSTPVIDVGLRTLYLTSYTNDASTGGVPQYVLHAISLETLRDRVPPAIIAGSQKLSDGSTLAFNATIHRQRPALLEYGGVIYVAFGSICDNKAARGWVFAWSASTLAPVNHDDSGNPIPTLTNSDSTAPSGAFLASIWMSGAGPAADATGIYYVTGNSDSSGTTYNQVTNTEESLVRLSLDTTKVMDLFTPYKLSSWDHSDQDFGAGGLTLVPALKEGGPPLATAAGKRGTMYLMNRTDLGGYTPNGPDKVLSTVNIGPCWCAQSYFDDGYPTVVSSGGDTLRLWRVEPGKQPTLEARTPALVIPSGYTPLTGFMTSVSSHARNDVIVWAVTDPVSATDTRIWLYAFSVGLPGTKLQQIFAAPAGNWTVPDHNPHTVPVVANGRVYVGSTKMLAIFGLAPATAAPAAD